MASGMATGISASPKTWKELSVEDKLERMRSIIKGQDIKIGRLQTYTQKLERMLGLHKHLPPDQLTVVGLNEEHTSIASPSYGYDNEWGEAKQEDGPSDEVFF